jgi:hypothetical protein
LCIGKSICQYKAAFGIGIAYLDFTLSGDLIKTLHHPDPRQGQYSSPPDFIAWDLRTDDNRILASGTYCYHILGFDENGKEVIIFKS